MKPTGDTGLLVNLFNFWYSNACKHYRQFKLPNNDGDSNKERQKKKNKNNCLIEQNSNCRVFTLFGTFHCRCCRDFSVKFSIFTFYMHKTKDSVFLFGFSVFLFLDTVVLRIQLRENPPKCNNLNEMEYSHEVSNSVNWLLKWRFRSHRYRGWVSTLLQDHRKLIVVKCSKLKWQ